MSATTVGLFVGLILGVAAAAGGLVGFFIALVLGILGLVVGRVLDGELDLTQFTVKPEDTAGPPAGWGETFHEDE